MFAVRHGVALQHAVDLLPLRNLWAIWAMALGIGDARSFMGNMGNLAGMVTPACGMVRRRGARAISARRWAIWAIWAMAFYIAPLNRCTAT